MVDRPPRPPASANQTLVAVLVLTAVMFVLLAYLLLDGFDGF
jgi:hypothetical protein